VAILAGDGLFAEAYKLILTRQQSAPERVVTALGELSRAIGVGGMVGGQYVDVLGPEDLNEDGLRHLHELKTGRLIAASVAVAPLLLGAPSESRTALDRFSRELGVLFQIVDDILDVTGSEKETGKPGGSDARLGKRTYVSVFGLERADDLARASHGAARAALEQARTSLPGDPSDLERMTDFMLSRRS
jgi:geranylgeranyl diphosphate synthase type II